MMKQNYNNKAKHRSAWFAFVLLMITALPITAQNKGDRFQVDNSYWYEVVDAAAKTVKLTYGNENLNKAQARAVEFTNVFDEIASIPDLKGYEGKVPTTKKDEYILDTPFKGDTPDADQKHKIDVVVIPASVKYNNKDWTVVAIGSYAFINERKIGNVELPATIESIEDCAFYQCSVTMLNFPENLKYIGWRAFYKTNLAPYTVKSVGNTKKGFKHTKKNEPINILGETAIGPQAFEGSSSKSTFTCPKITFVGYQAFKGTQFNITQNRTKVSIPATAKIGEPTEDTTIKAMYNNLDPAVTDYRSGVESFAEFSGTVSLAEGPLTIPTGMFENAFNTLLNFVIPSTVTSIDERAFANTDIKSFNDLSKVTKIGARAFQNCAMSGDFVIGEQVEEVGDAAFAGNSNLAGVTLKGTANCKIGVGIFEGCPELEYIDLRNMNSADAKSKLKNLSREFNSGTITAGLPTHTVVYLPDAQDISFAAGQDVNFVKFDGTCTKLSLQDGAEYEFPYAFTANEVVYNKCNIKLKYSDIDRGYNTTQLKISHYDGVDNSLTTYRDFSKFADGKHCFTVFLPYAVTLKPGIRAYKLDYKYTKKYFIGGFGTPTDTEFYVFNSIPDGSTLEANKPYLLRITNANSDNSNCKAFMANNVEIAKSPTDKYTGTNGRLKPVGFAATKPGQSFSFRGSTESLPFNTYGEDQKRPYVLNIIKKNTIEGEKEIDVWRQMKNDKPKGHAIPAFRGFIYLKPGTSGAKQFMVLSDDETTGINDVTTDVDAQQGAQRIYTIDGRYVGTNFDSLPSGMYIMKGKKTLKTK